ncbi:MAG: molybdopterin cofactor-binding domain-containing protein [Deinococcales bacterium]
MGAQEHFYLETQASIAYLDEHGQVMVHSSTQHPAETQEVVAQVLGLPRHAVTVQSLRMGGGFGGKEVQAQSLCLGCSFRCLSHQGRCVRLNRSQDIT